jgi:hypothetical protein
MALADDFLTLPAAPRTAAREIGIPRVEWLWPLLVLLATLLLAEVPHLLAQAEGRQGAISGGLPWAASDVSHYAAAMREAAASPSWDVQEQLALELQRPPNVSTFYLALGKLTALLGAPAGVVYHLVEVAARALLVGTIYLLAVEVLPSVTQRRLALTLALFSSGLGALAALPLQALGLRPLLSSPEFFDPELNTFLVLFTPPHLILGLALLLLAAWFYLRAWYHEGWAWPLLCGLIVLGLGAVNPFGLVTVCLGLAIHLVYCWERSRQVPRRVLRATGLMLLAALPFFVSALLTVSSDPLWQEVYGQRGGLASPSLVELLVSLAPLLVLALIGLPPLLERRGTATALAAAWIAACVALMYLPIGPQRRFALGLAPLLALIAAAGLEDAWSWLRRTRSLNLRLERGFLLFALVEVLFASNLLLYAIIVTTAAQPTAAPLPDRQLVQPLAETRDREPTGGRS